MSEQQIQLVDQEISELLENGSIQPFSCGKEGWGKPFTDKSEKTQYIHPLQALPNKRFTLSGISCREKPFSVQDRSQRHLLRNSLTNFLT